MNEQELYEKAQYFQHSEKEFAKALGIYQEIVENYPNTQEAYYSEIAISDIEELGVTTPDFEFTKEQIEIIKKRLQIKEEQKRKQKCIEEKLRPFKEEQRRKQERIDEEQRRIDEEQRRIDEEQRRIDEEQIKIDSVVITTTNNIDGFRTKNYIDIESVEIVLGTGLGSEITTSIEDFFGKRSSAFEEKLQKAKKIAFQKLKRRAFEMGGNAIIGIDIDYTEFTSNRIGLIVNGTIVEIEKIDELRDVGKFV